MLIEYLLQKCSWFQLVKAKIVFDNGFEVVEGELGY